MARAISQRLQKQTESHGRTSQDINMTSFFCTQYLRLNTVYTVLRFPERCTLITLARLWTIHHSQTTPEPRSHWSTTSPILGLTSPSLFSKYDPLQRPSLSTLLHQIPKHTALSAQQLPRRPKLLRLPFTHN